jgi:hypothetical protein
MSDLIRLYFINHDVLPISVSPVRLLEQVIKVIGHAGGV